MKITGYFGLIILSLVLNGLVISALWGWYIVPLGVPQIGIAHALGIATIASMLSPNTKDETEGEPALLVIKAVAPPCGAFAFGALIHLFM